MADWMKMVRAGLEQGEPVALVSILATEGSTPRGAGTRMLVGHDRAEGSIGGGALEHQAMAQARALLMLPPGSWRVQDYPLGPMLGQCCGGRVRLLIERLDPDDAQWLEGPPQGRALRIALEPDHVRRSHIDAPPAPIAARHERPGVGSAWIERVGVSMRPVYLFGAGHVGAALARLLRNLPVQLAWFDTRHEMAAMGATQADDDALVRCSSDVPPDAAVLIMTHDHQLDYRLTRAALSGPARFVGLIGSATKRARFLSRLRADGISEDGCARLICPIGVGGIVGKEPEVIAISVAAQLLQLEAA